MNADLTASMLYLMLLLAVLGSAFFLSGRVSLGAGLRQAGAWVLIFLGVIVAYGLWGDLRSTVMPAQQVFAEQGRIEVPMSADGHYYLTLEINGVPVRFVVDTGASDMVLSQQDARRIGLPVETLQFVGAAGTANGVVRTARVRLDEVALGGLSERRVPAVVNGGEMQGSLLGMAFLNRFSQVSFGNGRMILTR